MQKPVVQGELNYMINTKRVDSHGYVWHFARSEKDHVFVCQYHVASGCCHRSFRNFPHWTPSSCGKLWRLKNQKQQAEEEPTIESSLSLFWYQWCNSIPKSALNSLKTYENISLQHPGLPLEVVHRQRVYRLHSGWRAQFAGLWSNSGVNWNDCWLVCCCRWWWFCFTLEL